METELDQLDQQLEAEAAAAMEELQGIEQDIDKQMKAAETVQKMIDEIRGTQAAMESVAMAA